MVRLSVELLDLATRSASYIDTGFGSFRNTVRVEDPGGSFDAVDIGPAGIAVDYATCCRREVSISQVEGSFLRSRSEVSR